MTITNQYLVLTVDVSLQVRTDRDRGRGGIGGTASIVEIVARTR